jgi:predicted CXXCH cytochrome family protein
MNSDRAFVGRFWGLAALVLSQVACGPQGRAKETGAGSSSEGPRLRSNILRSDYAGSAECESCHSDVFAAWKSSPMRHMTRHAESAHVRAPFDGTVFRLKNDSAVMEQLGGQRFMRLVSPERGTRLYRITKVIGGRYREDFAGVDVTGAADPVNAPGRGAETVLPVSYVFSTRSWRYKGYSVTVPERDALKAAPVWSKTCIGCHNTLPYVSMLYDDLYGRGAASYQGSVSDDLLPPSRTWNVVVTDQQELMSAVADELAFLGAERPNPEDTSLRDLLGQAIAETRRRLNGDHLVEVGVGCEACHGGAREHVENHRVRPAFDLRSSFLQVEPPPGTAPTRAQWINRTCARCHTVLFSRYEWTWEGGRRADSPPGGSSTNSGEARDFLLGACSSQMSCASCHDPHGEDRRERLDALAGPAGNEVCTSCHTKLASADAVRAHSHHQPGSAGSACVACHMPKKNMGLDYDLTRYHRIGSPTDEAKVQGDRPIECALCHQDKSVTVLVKTMERWWGKRYDWRALRALYGDDLRVNALESTLSRGKPHEQAVAIAVLGERGTKDAIPLLVPHLSHEYPLVRFYARRAIERLLGEELPIDPNLPGTEISTLAAEWLSARQAEGR